MGLWRPRLEHFHQAAAQALGVEVEQVRRMTRAALAESALAAPFAGFAGHEPYPTVAEKAAVLVERIARNHALPDGNKRTAFVLGVTFCELNGLIWGEQDVERDAALVEDLAAGRAGHEQAVAWVLERTRTG